MAFKGKLTHNRPVVKLFEFSDALKNIYALAYQKFIKTSVGN